jgi:Extensin-like protein C-terminus
MSGSIGNRQAYRYADVSFDERRAFARRAAATQLIHVKVLGAIALLFATTVSVIAETVPVPRARPVGIPGAETVVSPCRSRLAEIADFKPLPSITGPGDCTATDVVELDALFVADRHRIALSPAATLRCPMAEAVTHWIRDHVAPTIAASGNSLRAVETLDSFDCRHRNGVADAKISEHGRANALDVSAFKLANGAAIELTDASVAKSLREKLRQSACSRFSTVLGNGADAYHDSHVHLDLLERNNHYRICQWDVLDVAETAALAAKKAAATAESNRTIVKASAVPLPRPRPIALSDRPRNRIVRLRQIERRPLFSLFAPLSKARPR